MIATFVGGPYHGDHQSMECPPRTVTADNADGTQVHYERRFASAEDARQQVTVQVFYAPVLMPMEEFTRRSRKLRVPADSMCQERCVAQTSGVARVPVPA